MGGWVTEEGTWVEKPLAVPLQHLVFVGVSCDEDVHVELPLQHA